MSNFEKDRDIDFSREVDEVFSVEMEYPSFSGKGYDWDLYDNFKSYETAYFEGEALASRGYAVRIKRGREVLAQWEGTSL